jgi:hypothetical protein
MKYIFTNCLLFLLTLTHAQDLTGTWICTNCTGNRQDDGYMELVLRMTGSDLVGYSYDRENGFCIADFEGNYDSYDKLLSGINTRMVKKSGGHVISAYQLFYYREGNNEYLQGRITTNRNYINNFNGRFSDNFWGDRVTYIKKSNKPDSTLVKPQLFANYKLIWPDIAKKERALAADELKKSKALAKQQQTTNNNPPPTPTQIQNTIDKLKDANKPQPDTTKAVVAQPIDKNSIIAIQKNKRTSVPIQTIQTNADSITVNLYDNAEVDNDTLTVFLNNQILHANVRLSLQPYTFKIAIPKNGQKQSLEFFANNLGDIAPNTAYVLIQANSKRYELRSSADFSTNSKIDFVYKPD